MFRRPSPPPRTQDAAAHPYQRRTRRRQHQYADRRSPRPGAAAGHLAAREAGALRPRGDPRAAHARQGLGRLRPLHGHARHHAPHQGQAVRRHRQEDRSLRALLYGGRRARRGGCRTRHPWLLSQVLHRRGQLGSGGQQHTGLLPARPAALPRPEPRRQARPAHQPAQRAEQLGLLDPAARSTAPGHLCDGRPRPARRLPLHARLRQPRLQLHQRGQ